MIERTYTMHLKSNFAKDKRTITITENQLYRIVNLLRRDLERERERKESIGTLEEFFI